MKTRSAFLAVPVLAAGFYCALARQTLLLAGQPVALASGAVVDFTFDDKFKEAPSILKHACQDNPDTPVSTATLVQVFDAAKAPMEHREGVAVKAKGAYSSEVLQGPSDGILL